MTNKKNKKQNEQFFIDKDISLSTDFNRYLAMHEDILKNAPQNPCIVTTDSEDVDYSKRSITIGKKVGNGDCFVAEKKKKTWTLVPLSEYELENNLVS